MLRSSNPILSKKDAFMPQHPTREAGHALYPVTPTPQTPLPAGSVRPAWSSRPRAG